MVEKVVDPNLECDCGKLPLDAALFSYYRYKEDLTKVNFFLQRVKRVDPVHSNTIRTPLHIACEYNDFEMVTLLLNRGANIKHVQLNKS
jgi:ankyrin repeat protein